MGNRRGGRIKGRNSSLVRIRNTTKHLHKYETKLITGNALYNHERVCRDCGHVSDRYYVDVKEE